MFTLGLSDSLAMYLTHSVALVALASSKYATALKYKTDLTATGNVSEVGAAYPRQHSPVSTPC